jgi:hypothetical protein
MYGPPGISKTSSIILYSYLCYLINQYEFEYDEVVAPDIERLFYVSYTSEFKDEKSLNQHIKKMLISHCPSKFANELKNA